MTIGRSVFRRCIFVGVLLVVANWAVAQAERCQLPEESGTTLNLLYKHALTAGVPYENPIPDPLRIAAECDNRDLFELTVTPLSVEDRKGIEAVQSRFHAERDASFGAVTWHNIVDMDGLNYASCGANQSVVGIFPMRRRIPNYDNGYFIRIVGVILDFGFIVPRKTTIGKELIRSIGLEKTSFGEHLVAIRGTDFLKIDEVWTSVRDLLSSSCALDLAISVAAYYAGKYQEDEYFDNYVVVGHSLGGIATQYVARDHAANGFRWRRITTPTKYYSFNSLGMRRSDKDGDLSNLYSYFIKADVVSTFGSIIGRKQIGHSIRYDPPGKFDDLEAEEFRKILYQGSIIDRLKVPLERHSLGFVHESICNCEVNNSGNIVIIGP